MKYYDVIVAGGGPAGLSAAIYTCRYGLRTLVIEKMICGGQPALAVKVENYPGFEAIDGWELTRKFYRQAVKNGAEIREEEEVLSVEVREDIKLVRTSLGEYESGALIVATGGTPKRLRVEGEEEYLRRGVHYCAQCAGHAYKGKRVAVIGSGDSALDAALFLSEIASQVFIISKKDYLSGQKVLIDAVSSKPNVDVLLNSEVAGFYGDGSSLEGVLLKDGRRLDVSAAFVYIGFVPNSHIVDVEKTPGGFIKVDSQMRTSLPGVFACGNVVRKNAQIVSSAGEGAIAALSAVEYLRDKI